MAFETFDQLEEAIVETITVYEAAPYNKNYSPHELLSQAITKHLNSFTKTELVLFVLNNPIIGDANSMRMVDGRTSLGQLARDMVYGYCRLNIAPPVIPEPEDDEDE